MIVMDSMKMKFFTIEEANLLLPEVKSSIYEMSRTRDLLVEQLMQAGELKVKMGLNGNRKALKQKIEEIMGLQNNLAEYGKILMEKGLILRDLDKGLVDFPTIIAGDLGYFCWRLGEDSVDHWHPVNEGSRQLITHDIKILHQGDEGSSQNLN